MINNRALAHAVVLVVQAGTVSAQGAASPAADDLQDIIVTATRRAQNIQDVPIAVSAFGADTLRRAGVSDARDLQILAPSLVVASTGSDAFGTSFRIRGVGTVGLNPGLESAVGTFIDGVYRSRSAVGLSDVPGVERVEVLRGPQGTLFGKNTTAGLISITTKEPGFETEAEVAGTLGSYSTRELTGSVSGPLAGNVLAARIDGGWRRADGYVTDFVTGRDYMNKDRWSLRGQLLFTPSDDVRLRIIGDIARRNDDTLDVQVYRSISPDSVALISALGGIPPRLGLQTYETALDTPPEEMTQDAGISAQLDWTTGIGTIVAISAYRDWSHVASYDVDQTTLNLAFADRNSESFRTFTQEVRLQGDVGKLDFVVGLFFADERLDTISNYKVGADFERYFDAVLGAPGFFSAFTGLPPGSNFPLGAGADQDRFAQHATSFAGFTHNTLQLSDSFSLTAGLRITTETKRVSATLDADNPACSATVANGAIDILASFGLDALVCIPNFDTRRNGTFSDRRSETNVSGVVSAAYVLADDINSYASYSRGYKAGGFNLDRSGFSDPRIEAPDAAQLRFEPETVDAFEIGLKARLFDRRVTVNTALFWSNFSDFQLTYNSGTSLLTLNVPKVTSKGVEVETAFAPASAWRLTAAATYADTRYGDIPDSFPTNIRRLGGERLANAPLWVLSGSAGFDDDIPVFNLRGTASADVRWQSAQQTENLLAPGGGESAYALVNARIGVGARDGRWGLELFVRNLFNERRLQQSIDTTLSLGLNHSGWVIEPRRFGVTLRAKI